MFNLFDFDYCEYKASLLLQVDLSKEEKKTFIQLLKTQDAGNALENIGKTLNVVPKLRAVNEQLPDSALEILTRHLSIITQYAFPKLNDLPAVDKRIIFNHFLDLMREQRHWPESIVDDMRHKIGVIDVEGMTLRRK